MKIVQLKGRIQCQAVPKTPETGNALEWRKNNYKDPHHCQGIARVSIDGVELCRRHAGEVVLAHYLEPLPVDYKLEGDGYYWFKSERAWDRSIVQRVKGQWFPINEVGPIELSELAHRGWHVDEKVIDVKVDDDFVEFAVTMVINHYKPEQIEAMKAWYDYLLTEAARFMPKDKPPSSSASFFEANKCIVTAMRIKAELQRIGEWPSVSG